jgi:hypothetical protein
VDVRGLVDPGGMYHTTLPHPAPADGRAAVGSTVSLPWTLAVFVTPILAWPGFDRWTTLPRIVCATNSLTAAAVVFAVGDS